MPADDPANSGVPVPPAFPIVGLGASAGGLEALTQVLGHLPAETGMAFVLVQHLDPTHESQLAAILSKATLLPVLEARDGLVVLPNHVYVIPPNARMTIHHGTLQLSPRGDSAAPHLTIDLFFRALAADRQDRSIGVVLSGTGFDGTLGLAEIKAVGGITFAQDEASAKYPGMPQHAIDSGCVDFVLPPEGIAQQLAQIAQHPYLRCPPPAEAAPPPAPPEPEGVYEHILDLLKAVRGVSFHEYRDNTIRRRITRRMALCRRESLDAYARFLEENRPELEALYHDILISVTSFFRDPEVFEALKTLVFPQILAGKSADVPIRIWTPGCATGQETYSLAIALLEFLDHAPVRPPIQIFGTDISDTASVDRARLGHYPPSIEGEVSRERLSRFFVKSDGGYRIGKVVRELCAFAKQNLATDPPFSRMDLISCRNVLIYLAPPLQQRLIPMFHYGLNPTGFLLLGASESVGRFTDLFQAVDKKHRIYSKNPAVVRPFPTLPASPRMPPPPDVARPPAIGRPPSVADLQKEADRIALRRFAPAGVLVNEELEVVQFRGRTRAYLEPPSGEATYHVLRMARESLFVPLRNALEQARAKQTTVRVEGVPLRDENTLREIDLEVIPVRHPGTANGGFLVHFYEPPALAGTPPEAARTAAPLSPEQAGELEQMREELAGTRAYLQSIIEQQSAANEELQSANEEVLSTNEELQSTNEELQTAKEEAQSINEELTTVNEELQNRNGELAQLGDDLTNLLGSVNIPIIMLGMDLTIRRFTPAAAKALGLDAVDLGRPLDHVRLALDLPDLKDLTLNVTESLTALEREVRDNQGRWRALRVTPYRTADNRIDGVTLVLLDIDEMRRTQDALHQANLAKEHFIAALSHELRTPLTPALLALASVLRDARTPPALAEDLRLVERNVALEVHLIDDLLDVTRITHGKIELRREPLEIADVLRDAAAITASDMAAKGQTLDMILPDTPCGVWGDRARLQQVFWNLLRNAGKFSPAGSRIELTATVSAGLVRITVTDVGIGIEPQVLPRLFQAFEQGRGANGFGGLGLGLAIARGIVELHGGWIGAQSPGKDRGATFTVELPRTAAPPAAAAPPTAAAAPPAAPVRPLHILLVEDHADTARIMTRLLENEGHRVTWAASLKAAREAVQAAPGEGQEGGMDVFLCDLGLPDGTGYDLMQHLRAAGRNMPGIAVSGYGTADDRQRCLAAGFAAHLTKPIAFEPLYQALRRVVAAR